MITENVTLSAASGKYDDGSSTLVDSFVPGAISNRALEHLTETMVRPQQLRAIRGEQQPAMSYASSQYVHLFVTMVDGCWLLRISYGELM